MHVHVGRGGFDVCLAKPLAVRAAPDVALAGDLAAQLSRHGLGGEHIGQAQRHTLEGITRANRAVLPDVGVHAQRGLILDQAGLTDA